ncbi:MAG TPA: peptide ABC transporter substrate-binding protein [Aliidongia sp.]|nr:peptide ABC transporter substrate-binding protein [Aliidongia sp.]
MRLSSRPLAGLLAIGLTLAATSADAAQVLRRPVDSEPDTLDPQKTSSAVPISIGRDLFAGLAMLDEHEKPVPAAAESWDVSPDKRVWTFHLRHDGKWSNGDPVTSADFLYSFRRLVDPATAAADPSDLNQVVGYEAIISGKEKDLSKLGVEAPDPYTLTITLNEPRIAFPLLLTDWGLFPLHRASIEKWGKDWTQPGHLVSNGAYRLKSWTPQTDLVLEKNPLFYDAASVKIDEVHWLNAEDPEAALRRYRAGELDWVGLTRNNLGWAKQNLADQFHSAPANQHAFMPINMVKGPLATDARLREALNLAVDREVLVSKLDPRGELPAYSIVPPVISDYTPQEMGFKSLSQADRLKKAKELMAAAGYGPDHPLTLTAIYPTQESTRQLLLGIAAMWKPIGVDLKLDNMEWQVYISDINQRNYELGMMGEYGSYNDYESALDNYRSDAGQFNAPGYASAKFDDLFHRGGIARDMEIRRDLMQQAERVVIDDYATIPLEFGVINRVINPKLQGPVATEYYPQTRLLSFKN